MAIESVMDLTIITVTWNSAARIADQIRSVICAGDKMSFEQIIVDNASDDDTASVIQKNFPRVRFIQNEKNSGFAAANNQAWREAQGEFILFLNPDMKLLPRTLDRLAQWMRQHQEVGIAGCRLIGAEGKINQRTTPRRFPTLFNQLAIFLKLPRLFPRLLDSYLMRDIDWDKEQAVDSVQGSCLLARRELLEKLGRVFDERYFIWFEDVDLCREARRLGYTVMYTPIASCVDYGGESFQQRNAVWKQWQFFRSAIKYFWKWRRSAIR